MNPQDFDHPDLTAYALGELSPSDTARVRQWLARSPEACAELERIQQTIGVLQESAALPKRTLHPRQRETVLAMGQIPAPRPKNVVPFLGFRRPASGGRRLAPTPSSVAWRAVKFAVAACLVVGAFLMGQKTASRITPLVVEQDVKQPTLTAPAPQKTEAAPVPDTKQVAEAAVPGPKLQPALPAMSMPRSEAAPTAAADPVPSTAAAEVKAAPAPGSAPAPPAPVVTVAKAPPPTNPSPVPAPFSLKGFAQTATSPEAVLRVHPQSFRPLPVPHEFAGVVLASPLPLDAKPDQAPRKPESQPALVIHSWKAEIASCPWDPGRRLMRFVAQIPVDQPGIGDYDKDYTLVAKFDPFHVQGFRLVTEKHLRASGGGTQATRFAWYEIIPTRNFSAAADKPVTIGTISVEQPRGAAPDTAPLKLVDRGLEWKDAREDFIFETAMIGWNMLLNGAENISGLNSRLVLDLAEKTGGEDAKGERAKFIHAVKQAQRAVGL